MLSAGLAVLVPVVIVGVPVADTILSIVRRVLLRIELPSGTGVMEADKGHIHHKLLALGLNQRRAVLVLHGIGLALALLGFGSLFLSSTASAIFLAALLGAAFIGISRLGYDELAVIRKGTILRLYDLPALKTGFFVGFADLFLAVLALYLAIGLKWDDWGLLQHRSLALELGAIVPALVFVTFQLFGLYKGRWRHASLEDLLRPTAAVLLTGAGAALADTLALGGDGPLSFFFVFTLVLLVLANGSRSSYRLLAYWRARTSKPGMPVLLFGAGRRGSMAVRELSASVDAPLRAIGFVDNDPEKRGLLLNGIPVLGCFEQLEGLIEKHGARGVVVTSPKIPPVVSEEIEEVCLRRGIAYLQFHITFEGTLIASRDRAKEGAVAVGNSPAVDPNVSKVTPCR
jgi:UDP-GlcNAc:undecaprenyl-phosphate GlcNAc-1-phosphate transferase